LAFNNFVLFDRVHLPIIGKRAAVVEEDSLSVRELRPRKDRCGFALISDVLPFGRLWYGEPNAIGYAKFYSRSSQCASATKIVRPSESTADTPAPIETGFAEIVSDDLPVLHLDFACIVACH
jgi:hypothetical protein